MKGAEREQSSASLGWRREGKRYGEQHEGAYIEQWEAAAAVIDRCREFMIFCDAILVGTHTACIGTGLFDVAVAAMERLYSFA